MGTVELADAFLANPVPLAMSDDSSEEETRSPIHVVNTCLATALNMRTELVKVTAVLRFEVQMASEILSRLNRSLTAIDEGHAALAASEAQLSGDGRQAVRDTVESIARWKAGVGDLANFIAVTGELLQQRLVDFQAPLLSNTGIALPPPDSRLFDW